MNDDEANGQAFSLFGEMPMYGGMQTADPEETSPSDAALRAIPAMPALRIPAMPGIASTPFVPLQEAGPREWRTIAWPCCPRNRG